MNNAHYLYNAELAIGQQSKFISY